MLTFLSAFLGLVVGVHPVEVTVTGDVVAVEIRLDGKSIGQLQGPPWVLACDFGQELAPHELVAIGRDADGREIARASQWLNLPRPRSQAELVLVGPADKPQSARLVWSSADGAAPDAWRLSFDGEILDVADPRSFGLPAYDAAKIHLLQAELRFGTSFATTEVTVGGAAGDLVAAELTAFPVVVRRGKPPAAAEMAGWFVKDGRDLEVVSVERGGADIVIIQEATPRLWGKLLRLHKDSMAHRGQDALSRKLTSGLNEDDRLRVLLPVGEAAAGDTMEQFHISYDFSTIEYGPSSTGVVEKQIAAPQARGVLATLPYPFEGPLRDDAPRRVADAVAVAAQVVTAGRRARAVVLIKDEGTRDLSTFSPAMVRRYLERLQVPLLVWSPERSKKQDAWGEVLNISTSREFLRGVLQLRQTLDGQAVVWLRGRHLPQEIELSPAAAQRLERVGAAGGAETTPEQELEIEQWIATAPGAAAADAPIEAPSAAPEASAETVAEAVTDASSETVVDTVEVRLVNLEVVVTDADGNRRRDLGRDDFEVYEDGERVEISHFVSPEDSAPGSASSAARPGATAGAAAADDAPRLVIFFDLLRLDPSARKRLAKALREVLAEAPAMRTMIVTYDRTVNIRVPFTAESMALAEILGEIENGAAARTGGPDQRAQMADELAAVQVELKRASTAEEVQRAEDRRDGLLIQLDNLGRSLSAEIRGTVGALRRLTSGLGGVEGRKILLYVGDNLELSPARELFEEAQLTLAANELETSRLRSAGGSLAVENEFDDLLGEANANRVTFYAVTPKNRGSGGGAERSTAGPGGFQGRLASSRQELVKEAVCRLSGESGGLCQAGAAEPRQLLQETVDDLGAYYSLAYTPGHPADGSFHRLEVKLSDDDLEARYRGGYTDKKLDARLHDLLAAALYYDDGEDSLGVTIEAGEIEPPGTRPQALLPLDVRVAVERLGMVPLEGGAKLGARARLLVVTRDQAGVVSGVQEYPISFQVKSERLAAQPPLVYAHKLHLLLEPGSYQIAIGLWDEIGRLGSFLSRTVTVE